MDERLKKLQSRWSDMKMISTRTCIRAAQPGTYSVLFAGDFCPRFENCDFVAENAEEIVRRIKPEFDQSDFRVLQWECAITEQDTPIAKSGPNHRCSPACIRFAEALGIHIALLANNHTGDYGPAAAMETGRHLQQAGMRTVGIGENRTAAAEPLFVNTGKSTFAIINIAENEFGMATAHTPGCNPLDLPENLRQIHDARGRADTLIVAIHGGHENNPFPSPRMVATYRCFIDAGADAVFNCHTHCPEGMEVYRGKPILYSPGNFYFPARSTNTLRSWGQGYLVRFLCDSAGIYGWELAPYCFSRAGIVPLEGKDREAFFRYLGQISEPIGNAEQLQRYFDLWSAKLGVDYLRSSAVGLALPDDFSNQDEVHRWLHFRNLVSCESHHDMIRNTLRLMETGALTEAAENFAAISHFQQMNELEPLR